MQDLEGVISWMDGDAWDRFAGPVTRLTRLIPEETLVGYHLCYGTFGGWPMYEARDMGLMVKMANYAVGHSGRQVDFLHLAGPRNLRSEDERFYEPLLGLNVPDTRVYLGIILPIDGAEGCGAGMPPRRSTWTTSASPCTAVSAASRGRTAWRPCVSTERSCSRCARAAPPPPCTGPSMAEYRKEEARAWAREHLVGCSAVTIPSYR